MPVTLPHTFATKSGNVPASHLDANFLALADAVHLLDKRFANVINVLDHGFVADDATDNLPAWNALIAMVNALPAAQPVTIVFPPGVYRIHGRANPLTRSYLTIQGYGATLHQTGSSPPDANSIQIHGVLGAIATTITAGRARGDKTITVDSTAGFAAGQPIIIRQFEDVFARFILENEVESVDSGTVMTLRWPLGTSVNFPSHTFSVTVYIPVEHVTIQGLSFTQDNHLTTSGGPINIRYARWVTVEDVHVDRSFDGMVAFDLGGRGAVVRGGSCRRAFNTGVFASGFSDVKVIGVTFAAPGLDQEDNQDGNIILRSCPDAVVVGNTFYTTRSHAVAIHKCPGTKIIGNSAVHHDIEGTRPNKSTFHIGESDESVMAFNTSHTSRQTGITVTESSFVRVIGNIVRNAASEAAYRFRYCDDMVVIGNHAEIPGDVNAYVIDRHVRRVVFQGNTCVGGRRGLQGTKAAGDAFSLEDSMISNNSFISTNATVPTVELLAAKDTVVQNNVIRAPNVSDVTAIRVAAVGGVNSQGVRLINNTILTGGGAGSRGIRLDNTTATAVLGLETDALTPLSVGSGVTFGRVHFRTGAGTAAFDPPSVASGAQTTTTVTVPGATLGDTASVTFSLDLQGLLLTSYVSAADTVTVVFTNLTGGAVNLGSGTLRVATYRER